MQNIIDHLHIRMDALHSVQQEIRPDWEDYLASQTELDHATDETIENIHKARIMILTWVRAHQRMASGVTAPAEWFDPGSLTKQLIKTAPKTVQ